MSDKKLAGKLVEIIEALPMIEKKGRNAFHNYNYAMEVDFLEAVRPQLTKHGILMSMSVDSVEIVNKGEKGGMITTIKTSHTFIDSVTGETLTFHGAGQGEDKGDKGIYKAQTGALKYALAKFFLISTGDDPEAFNQKRMEAGKVTKRAKGQEAPQSPPPPSEAPPDRLKNGNHVPPNPWKGKLVTLSGPFTGEYKGKPWTRWDISTGSMELATFDKGVADVAGVAIADDVPVELIWVLKRSAKTGEEKCAAESIRILDPDEVGMQTSRAAAY
jgi:hypothetical protein